MSASPPPAATPDSLLQRPSSQRAREFKYRFGQSVVFGLPVLGLQWFGARLGGGEREAAERWVPLLQALLAGWITYVAAAGMLFDGLLRLLGRRGFSADLFVAGVAIAAYLYSLTSAAGVLVSGRILFRPLLFHLTVILLIAWSASRWWWLARQARGESRIAPPL